MQKLKPELSTKRSVGQGPNGKKVRESVRVDLGEVTLSKSEYKTIREFMLECEVSIGELCKYSMLSVIRAHNDDEEEEI